MVSPGIPLDTPAILKLQVAGVPVVGEAELAYRLKGRAGKHHGTMVRQQRQHWWEKS